MAIKFGYKAIKRPDDTWVRTPSIPITLIGEKESVDLIALVDSGADISVIPKEIAEVLGLKLEGEIEPAFGVGGTVPTIQTQVNVRVGRQHEDYRFSMPIKVIMSDYDLPPLLGRKGFFQEFIITFDERKEKVQLKRYTRKK